MKKKVGFIILLLGVIAMFNTGCRKKKDTIAEITVRNAAGVVVPGAYVRIYPKPSSTPTGSGGLLWDYNTTSNSSGVASFNFNEVYKLGQSGVVVAHIEVKYGGNVGTGVLKVEQETTSTTTVFI